MIYHLGMALKKYLHSVNVIHYVSFRAMASLLTSLFFSFIAGTWFINKSKIFFRARRRIYTPANHEVKDNMPTMGGLFIVTIVIITSLLWSDLTNITVWLFLLCLCLFGLIGFLDDWYKIYYEKGISERTKFIAQCGAAFVVIALWVSLTSPPLSICFPFVKSCMPFLGIWYVVWAVFLIVATSNAVNLTDGLDGLAINSLIANFATFSILLYLSGHLLFARYLNIPFTGNAELIISGAALVGSSIGFLWYNTYPAQIFMGDVGSLALGSALGFMALLSKQELLLPIAGGLFVLETLSVITQVISYKLTGKRIFKMAPLHHHFELIGWAEAKIVVRFAIITLILCIIALMTIKIR